MFKPKCYVQHPGLCKLSHGIFPILFPKQKSPPQQMLNTSSMCCRVICFTFYPL